jgi:hypothetical protein
MLASHNPVTHQTHDKSNQRGPGTFWDWSTGPVGVEALRPGPTAPGPPRNLLGRHSLWCLIRVGGGLRRRDVVADHAGGWITCDFARNIFERLRCLAGNKGELYT